MYVSRGLGSPGIPVRTFCRPEIAMITLRAAG
jgi:predicted MPP superfamily phosphohydrolase